MSARYRCPWCGSFTSPQAKEVRRHIVERHRNALLDVLSIIETYGTREEAIAP